MPEVVAIEGSEDADMVYKTFFLGANGASKNRKIEFDYNVPDDMSSDEYLDASYSILQEEKDKEMAIAKVSPTLFRDLKYKVVISPDVLNPRSEDLERAFALELYDRAISNPKANQDEIYKLLLETDPTTKKDPDKYVVQAPTPGMGGMPPDQSIMSNLPGTGGGNSPISAMSKSALSPSPSKMALPTLGR